MSQMVKYLRTKQASVTILADFGPEFNPPFPWRSKHQSENQCISLTWSIMSFKTGPVEAQGHSLAL